MHQENMIFTIHLMEK